MLTLTTSLYIKVILKLCPSVLQEKTDRLGELVRGKAGTGAFSKLCILKTNSHATYTTHLPVPQLGVSLLALLCTFDGHATPHIESYAHAQKRWAGTLHSHVVANGGDLCVEVTAENRHSSTPSATEQHIRKS